MRWPLGNSRIRVSLLLTLFFCSCFCPSVSHATQPQRKLIATQGRGYLETVDGYRVLHLKGTPQEMGYQHGVLMGKAVNENIDFLLTQGFNSFLKGGVDPNASDSALATLQMTIANILNSTFRDKVPQRFVTEMKALADGALMPEWKVMAANLIPELFHCSGFALLKEATAESKLYHGRILDYGVGIKLQDHAVLIIQEPQGKIPFVNVSYAGFIGSVTGMNNRQISIGEMGGAGQGKWNGIPMSFLVRMVLEDAQTLQQAMDIFKNNPRTCHYYYVIADAKINSAVGVSAEPEQIEFVQPGQPHKLLPHPVANTVLLSSGRRYENLVKLVTEGYGKFTQSSAIRLMDAPVAMGSNLHNALMVPADGVIWVANADPQGQPAWKQKYYRFDMNELISSRPPVCRPENKLPKDAQK